MIAQLSGKVISIVGSIVILDLSGVGYEVTCSNRALEHLVLGDEVSLVVYTEVKEDSLRLFGFEDQLEKQVFLLLIGVKGVGARSASEIISRIEKRELLRFIAAGDVTRLQSIKGIGKKTAERIVVELRDKVASYARESGAARLEMEVTLDASTQDAIAALEALGFPRKEAERAVAEVEQSAAISKMESGQIVKEALRYV